MRPELPDEEDFDEILTNIIDGDETLQRQLKMPKHSRKIRKGRDGKKNIGMRLKNTIRRWRL